MLRSIRAFATAANRKSRARWAGVGLGWSGGADWDEWWRGAISSGKKEAEEVEMNFKIRVSVASFFLPTRANRKEMLIKVLACTVDANAILSLLLLSPIDRLFLWKTTAITYTYHTILAVKE